MSHEFFPYHKASRLLCYFNSSPRFSLVKEADISHGIPTIEAPSGLKPDDSTTALATAARSGLYISASDFYADEDLAQLSTKVLNAPASNIKITP